MVDRTRSPCTVARVAAALLVSAASARGQDLLRSFYGEAAEEYAGSPYVIDDVSGDGRPDLLIVAPRDWESETFVRIYSGAEGQLLREHVGAYYTGFGWSAAPVGDVDADGWSDYAVGAPWKWPVSYGTVYVYSGQDGSLLHAIDARGNEFHFGWAITRLDDVDSDGHADFVVGIGYFNGVYGRIAVFSGADAHELWSLDGTDWDGFGRQLDSIEDLDGDGIREIVASRPWGATAYVRTGRSSFATPMCTRRVRTSP
jgi:hypothetical protein